MNVVMLCAHADDEVIFGFPVLQRAKRIICCSSDANNPERQWCKERIKGLKEVAKLVGAKVDYFDYNSEFYRAQVRNGDLDKMVDTIKSVIHLEPNDVLFTHNRWGEYGHLDHILVNQIANTLGCSFLTTDISLDAGWFKTKNLYEADPIKTYVNDLDFYNRCKQIYDRIGCWTWSKEPIKSCSLYMEI